MTMTSPGPANAHHRTAAAGPVLRGDDWRPHGTCLHLDPDFMFNTRRRSEALHICRRHCPVLDQCQAHTLKLTPPPTDCVMGGIAWRPYADRDRADRARAADAVEWTHCRLCTDDV